MLGLNSLKEIATRLPMSDISINIFTIKTDTDSTNKTNCVNGTCNKMSL